MLNGTAPSQNRERPGAGGSDVENRRLSGRHDCTFGFLAAPDVARAQADYPNHPIKLIVPFTAGGGVDTVARILGDDLKGILGQSVVIENMPGASGMRGAEAAVRSSRMAILCCCRRPARRP